MSTNTKPLYILIADCGDGSYSLNYTFNSELITKLRKAYDDDIMDHSNGMGVDGDGFSYDTMNVPIECTAASLGITSSMIADDFVEKLS